jgi:secreted PhoX family phosphatase
MMTYASRLEKRRTAALLGATTEFRKEEGITYNPEHRQLYIAISDIGKGMQADSKHDKGGPDHIRLPANYCGGIYALSLSASELSNKGRHISSRFVARDMRAILLGKEKAYSDPALAANKCDVDGISSPDNITYLPNSDTLIIGEDTKKHQNDVIWAHNLKDQSLDRIFSAPYGAEVTSPYWYPNINGFGYLMAVVQHPYGESDKDKLLNDQDLDSPVIYLGPFPRLGR